jgi:hypothetical protein
VGSFYHRTKDTLFRNFNENIRGSGLFLPDFQGRGQDREVQDLPDGLKRAGRETGKSLRNGLPVNFFSEQLPAYEVAFYVDLFVEVCREKIIIERIASFAPQLVITGSSFEHIAAVLTFGAWVEQFFSYCSCK